MISRGLGEINSDNVKERIMRDRVVEMNEISRVAGRIDQSRVETREGQKLLLEHEWFQKR